MSSVRCPHCGTANRVGSNYCNHCGVTLRDDESQPLATTSPPPTDTPPALPAPADEWANEQPWLRPETAAAEISPPDDHEQLPSTERRLVGNVQGLLEPLRIFSSDDLTEQAAIHTLPMAASLPLEAAQLRRWRTFLTTAPLLTELPITVQLNRLPSLRIPWLFWLLGLAVGLPIFLALPGPVGAPRLWPGVTEAYLAVQDLPAGSPVLIFWSYDPATAHEMDLLAEPLVIHLLERQLDPVIVTLLPNGAATARRLFQQARVRWFASQNLQLQSADVPQVAVHFLTGGAAVLPLLGQNLGVGLHGELAVERFAAVRTVTPPPVLTIVLAAEAEAAQQWLEQVQPLSQTPVIAFTGAGGDPLLRPYLDSGQLRGLVSGFDGAYGYQALRMQAGSLHPGPDLQPQLVAQNWGHLALLGIVVLGNLAGLLGRKHHE